MRTITPEAYTVYNFNELSEEAQERAIQKLWDINLDYEWYDTIYEDANEIGLKITEVDIHGHSIDGEFTQYPLYTAEKIIEEHGGMCDTYATAKDYLNKIKLAKNTGDDNGGDSALSVALDQEFLYNILQDYLSLLRTEYEYLGSEDAIIDTIECNSYEFTVDGELV